MAQDERGELLKIIELMLKKGAQLNIANTYEQTAPGIAESSSDQAIQKLFARAAAGDFEHMAVDEGESSVAVTAYGDQSAGESDQPNQTSLGIQASGESEYKTVDEDGNSAEATAMGNQSAGEDLMDVVIVALSLQGLYGNYPCFLPSQKKSQSIVSDQTIPMTTFN